MLKIWCLCTRICVFFPGNLKSTVLVHQECGMLEETALRCSRVVLIFLEAALSLDEPDLERVLEDLGALDLSTDAGPSATSVTMIDTSSN